MPSVQAGIGLACLGYVYAFPDNAPFAFGFTYDVFWGEIVLELHEYYYFVILRECNEESVSTKQYIQILHFIPLDLPSRLITVEMFNFVVWNYSFRLMKQIETTDDLLYPFYKLFSFCQCFRFSYID